MVQFGNDMVETRSNHEMPIPKVRSEAVFQCVIFSVVACFTFIASINLSRGEALIASIIWIALVTVATWTACKEAGGWRGFLINHLGDVLGQRFIESVPGSIRFGFQCLGHRFIQRSIPLDKVKAVEWTAGQATSMAKRDMNDWTVWLWFEHGNAAKTEAMRKWPGRNPEQDLCGIGPSDRKKRSEMLGLSVVGFLREAGVDLVQDSAAPACYIRRDDPDPFRS
jgi:hypothetical protein